MRETQPLTVRRFAAIALGWFCLGISPLGAIIPILPGWLFFCVGLMVLSAEYEWARDLRRRIQARFPRATARMESFASRWIPQAAEPIIVSAEPLPEPVLPKAA